MHGRPGRHRARSFLAALTAMAVATLGAVGAALPAGAADAPRIEVTEAAADGGQITVTGTGFAVDTTGVYVAQGLAGAADLYAAQAGDTLGDTTWVSSTTRLLREDGSFTVTLEVPAAGEDRAVYVSKAHGQGERDKSQNVIVPVQYSAPAGNDGDEGDGDEGGGDAGDGGTEPEPELEAPGDPAPTPDPEEGTPGEPAPIPGTPSPAPGGPTPAPDPGTVTPAIEVFVKSGATVVPIGDREVHDGDVLVVRGTGFDPRGNVGAIPGRPPIPGAQPQGSYVVFGAFEDVWRPSAGAPSSARVVIDQKWALAKDVLDGVPAMFQGSIRSQWAELTPEGTFEAELTVAAPESDDVPPNFGVATYPAGSASNAAGEFFVPVTYSGAKTPEVPEPGTPVEPEPGAPGPETPSGPALTVSPSTELHVDRDTTFTVRGTGFEGVRKPSSQGVYVNIGKVSVWTPGEVPDARLFTSTALVKKSDIAADGSFTATVTVPAGAADVGVPYAASTFCMHGCAETDRTLDAISDSFVFGTTGGPGLPSTPVDGGSAPAEPTTGTGTVASAGEDDVIRAGSPVSFTAAGFRAGESGIRVELHSDPVVLATGLVADAGGVLRHQVSIPADTPAGQHTLVVIGENHTVRIPVTVAEALPVCEARAVSGGTVTWGVKSAFREYVTGSVAGGSVTTSGVGGSGPFTWSGGRGTYNTTDRLGGASFAGSVRFAGHGGALDVTVSNLRVQVNGASRGTLFGDLRTGDTTRSGIALATLALGSGSASVSGDQVRWTGVPATLTPAAAAGFEGFYSAGESMDAVSFTLPLGAVTDCTATSGANLAQYGGALARTGADDPGVAALTALGLVTLGGALVVGARRVRRTAHV